MARDVAKDSGSGGGLQGLGDFPELHSEQDMLAWKREYNIRQREADWKKRQDESLMQKQVAWEVLNLEKENRLAAAREATRRQRLEAKICRKHEAVEHEYRDRCRDIENNKRAEQWEKKTNDSIINMVNSSKTEAMLKDSAAKQDKAARFTTLRNEADDRASKRASDADMNAKREDNIRRREADRQAREAQKAHELKHDTIADRAAVVKGFTDKNIQVPSVMVSTLTQSPSAAENEKRKAKREASLEAMRQARGLAKT